MNFTLLDNIDSLDDGFLATIVTTSGHTYQKPGARALFRRDQPFPTFGNLGALCADRDIVAQGAEAMREGRPRLIRIDTTAPEDARIGYGTSCGGVMEILIEPVLAPQREVYRSLRPHLQGTTPVFLVHDTKTGALSISSHEPSPAQDAVAERVDPLRCVVLYGATPLAAELHSVLSRTRFDVHVCDWRATYLDHLIEVSPSRRHLDDVAMDTRTFVVILSHSFERDRAMLRRALESDCAFIGLLSSTPRRDQMFAELISDGVDPGKLARVSSPVGIDIPGRSDAEIAVSIAAQLLKVDGS